MSLPWDPASEEMVDAAEKALRTFVDQWDTWPSDVGSPGVVLVGQLRERTRWNAVLWERALGRAVMTWLNVGDGGRVTVREGSSGR